MSKRKNSALWSLFTCVDEDLKFAKCDLCSHKLSYKTTISNLKRHLIKQHPNVIEFEYQKDGGEETIIYDDDVLIETTPTLSVVKRETQEKLKQVKQSPATPKVMTKRKRSELWSYFTRVDDSSSVAQCNICEHNLSYRSSITNLRKHLIKKHPTENLSNIKKEAKDETFIITNNQFTSTPKPAIQAYQEKSKQIKNSIMYNPKKIDRSLLNLFIHDFHAFSIVEDKGFIDFVRALNPSYKLPGKKAVSINMIQPMYERCYDLVQEKIKSVDSLCLTTDFWKSRNVDKYLAVTAHYTDDNFEFKSILLGCVLIEPGDTEGNLAQEIHNLTEKFDITNKILIAVTDNERNVKNAIVDHLQWEHFSCFVHTLNFIVQKSLDNNIKKVIDKVQSVIAHFKGSTVAMEQLSTCQETLGVPTPKKLIRDKNIMWNSMFYMLQRFLELEEAIKTTLDSLDHDFPEMQQEEWRILRDLCKVLKPFDEITMRISNETEVNAGQIIIFTNGLKSVCDKLKKEKLHETVKKVLGELIAGVSKKFSDLEENKALATCTFLDPRFKMVGFSDQSAADSIKNYVIELVSNKINEEREALQAGDNESKMDSATEVVDELSIFNDFDSKTAELKPKVLVTYADPSDADTVKNYVIEVVASVIKEDGKITRISKGNENGMDIDEDVDGFSIFQDFDTRTAVLKPKPESTAITEVSRYIDEPLLPRNQSPLTWWREKKHFYPNLEKIVREKFCMLATSVSSKKMFSKAGVVLSERVNRLNPKHLEKLLFLNCNSYVLERN